MTKQSFKIEEHFNQLLQSVGLNPVDTGGKISFYGQDPIMQSRIRLAASYAIPYMGCAAGAAMIWREKTGRAQDLHIDLRKAIHYIADVPWSTLNGQPYPMPFNPPERLCPYFDQFYETKDGRLFCPAGFYPIMERAWCDFLGAAPTHARVAEKIKEWNAFELEDKANAAGLIGAVVRTIEEWAATDCGKQLAQTPVIEIEKVGESAPVPLPLGTDRPLSGLRVISNTHEIAGSTVGKTLAEQGADALQVTTPREFFHDLIFLEAGMGMRQAYVDFKTPEGLRTMHALLKNADVIVENFRQKGFVEKGLDAKTVAIQYPGIIYVSLRGVTHHGPWATRGCFDPVAIPMTGLCALEGSLEAPKYPPYGLLNDVISGVFSTVGVYAALLRRSREGGSYIVRTSLARCSMWYGTLGFLEPGATQAEGEEHKLIEPDMLDIETPLGHLRRPAPCVEFSETPGRWAHSISYRGADKPEWLP